MVSQLCCIYLSNLLCCLFLKQSNYHCQWIVPTICSFTFLLWLYFIISYTLLYVSKISKTCAPPWASAFEIFISSNCQRLLYSKEQKVHSINKASNGTGSYDKSVTKGSAKPIASRVFKLKQPLQNRVPRGAGRQRWPLEHSERSTDRAGRREQVPLPHKKPWNSVVSRLFLMLFIVGTRSIKPHFDAQFERHFRICCQPFATIPPVTTSI